MENLELFLPSPNTQNLIIFTRKMKGKNLLFNDQIASISFLKKKIHLSVCMFTLGICQILLIQ